MVKNGVPFDLAFSLGETERAAFCIIFGEIDGGKFDWQQMEFTKAES